MMPSSAWRMRTLPSKAKGLVTTPTVRMPSSRATSATMGLPPVPVPPPIPQVTKTISVFSSALDSWLRFSSAAFRPTSGFAPAPLPWVSFSPIWSLKVALEASSACLSVLTATKSTPLVPESTMRLTTLLPPPPTPTTLMFTALLGSVSNPKDIFVSPYIFFVYEAITQNECTLLL